MQSATLPHYALDGRDRLIGEQPNQYVLRIRDLDSADKPREKLAELGPRHLSSAELTAIILGVGTKKEEVMNMAQRVLKEYGENAISREANPQLLADALRIPFGKACQIVAAFELGRRFFATRNGKPTVIRTAEHAYMHVQDMGNLSKEHLRGLYLNSRYEVIHEEVISVGSLTANIVHPREIFQPALTYNAVAVVIAHNHPSGTTTPTSADIAVTSQLVDAGHILGIDLLDHIIVTVSGYESIFGHLHD